MSDSTVKPQIIQPFARFRFSSIFIQPRSLFLAEHEAIIFQRIIKQENEFTKKNVPFIAKCIVKNDFYTYKSILIEQSLLPEQLNNFYNY